MHSHRILFQRFNNRTAVSLNSNKSNRTCVFLRRQISVYSVSLRSLGSFFGSPSHTTLHFLLFSSVSTCQMSWNLYSLHLFKKTVSCEYSCETRKLRDQNYRQRFRHVCLEKNSCQLYYTCFINKFCCNYVVEVYIVLSSETSCHFHRTSFKANKFPVTFDRFLSKGNSEFYFLVILNFPWSG